jgi:histidinol-phosphatase
VSPDLSLALELADAADAISLAAFRTELTLETKPDSSPVTEADRAVESELRRLLAKTAPQDSILGEEHGIDTRGSRGSRRWVVDPIDGTRNFTRGIPVWATLLALEEDGQPRVGVVSAPALGRRWWAESGSGAYASHDPIHVSAVDRIEGAVLSFALDRQLPEIVERAWHVRGFGDFWAHMLVAEGAVEVAVDAVGVAEWDLAAVRVIVEEAGGRFSDFSGASRIDSGSAISSNGLLHDEVLAAVAASTVEID